MKEQFPQGLRILREDGEATAADQRDLLHWIQEAQEDPVGKERLLTYLNALKSQLATSPTLMAQGMSWEESRRVLDQVYRTRELRHLNEWRPPAWTRFLDRLMRTLERWLQKHFPSMDAARFKWVERAAYGIILLLGILMIAWGIRWLRPLRLAKTASLRTTSLAAPQHDLDWRGWRERAQKKAQEGAFREAIRCSFLSVMIEGHHRGWWRYRTEATNQEHLAPLRTQPKKRDLLQQLMARYERAWYGMSQPGKAQFDDCMALVRHLETMA
jgi:hypothetical protein